VLQTTRDIIEELGERASQAAKAEETGLDRAPCIAMTETASVLCVPARDEADEIAGLMLVQLLCQRGVAARVLSAVTLSGEMLEQVAAESTSVVCVSALPPFAATHARYLCKRLRPKFPHLRIVVGIWQAAGVGQKTQERLKVIGIDAMATTLADAVEELGRLSQNSLLALAGNSKS
jgi:hypothetical protein